MTTTDLRMQPGLPMTLPCRVKQHGGCAGHFTLRSRMRKEWCRFECMCSCHFLDLEKVEL